MKTIFTYFLIVLPFLCQGQTADSVTILRVDSLIEVSRTLTFKRDFDSALEVNAKAEELAKEKLGKESAVYGDCCYNRGWIFHNKTDYKNAEEWYLKAKDVREIVLGTEHPDYAESLLNLAKLYGYTGQFAKAEPLNIKAIEIRGKVFGKEDPKYAQCLTQLAILYTRSGFFEKAEPLNIEAKDIIEKTFGKEHPEYAKNLSNLGILYSSSGNYEKAEPLFIEVKQLREKTLGVEHMDYAGSLINLAQLYFTMGQLEKAEPLYLEAMPILIKAVGSEHPYIALILNNLAIVYRNMGLFKEAESHYLEAIEIKKKTMGEEYATIIYNLGNLYNDMGQYDKAEPILLSAKDIRAKSLGTDHPDYAKSLIGLGNFYSQVGQYEKAKALYLEGIDIISKALGEKHLEYAQSLVNLSNLHVKLFEYDEAESLLIQAKDIFINAVGNEHPDYTACLNGFVKMYTSKEQIDLAEKYIVELSTLDKRRITKALQHLSEREMNNYLEKFSETQDQFMSFAWQYDSETVNGICFNNSLFYKGFLLNAANQNRRLALSNINATEKYNRLKGYQRRLAIQYATPLAERDSLQIAELETKANDLEKDLSRTVAGFGETLQQVDWKEVQSALQPGEVAVEFVHYRLTGKKTTDSIMYAAMVLHAGRTIPSFIPLFEERTLDSLFLSGVERRADYVNSLYTMDERGAQAVEPPKRTLYELIWQPMEPEIVDIHSIYYSPTGLLHRLNMGAVPLSDEESLSDRYKLTMLNSTRQLVIPIEVNVLAEEAILYGGAHYEMDSLVLAAAKANNNSELLATRGRQSLNEEDRMSRGGSWGYLKWTDKEVDKVGSILNNAGIKPIYKKAYEATEESFKAIGCANSSPRILHIATHGFFFPDPKTEIQNPRSQIDHREPIFKMSDHPMIRSGLIMAGGNYAWQTGQPFEPELEDGILTAYEISQMNLSNTELVVLSACETGLGDIQGNEGVYGLQRAFKIAGVKYLIMSLWQVPDKETAYFMGLFYQHLTEGALSIPEAFRATQKELRQNPFASPYDWAGFVLME